MKYKFLEHTADIKFQALGKNLEEVFCNCAYALTDSIIETKIKSNKKIKFKVKGNDLENLLYNFLEEFLFLCETENFVLSKIKNLKIEKKSKNYFLFCEISGDKSKKYTIKEHVKAITYSEMFIKKIKGKFIAQVVLDV